MAQQFATLPFRPADILLPQGCDLKKWAVVACDQYSSQPEYWAEVERFVGGAPSTLRMILPETQLKAPDVDDRIAAINASMRAYWDGGVFQVLKDSFVYLERTVSSGRVRRGLVGMVDLEAYDYLPGSGGAVRATEDTVQARIPPRVRVRQDALLELPHVILLMDDPADSVLGPLTAAKDRLKSVYGFDLMAQGGRLCGWQVSGREAVAVQESLTALQAASPMLFAVGDGNHSLATAKTCYEQLKASDPARDWSAHPARYALVEVENIHDAALVFEPIHRVVSGIVAEELLAALRQASVPDGHGVTCVWAGGRETVFLDRGASRLAVGTLQQFLDSWLCGRGGEIDYIHGEDVACALAEKPDTVAFLLPSMNKGDLFPSVLADGVLPRKTFSMGTANEKRFYMEGRLIRDDV